MGDARTHEYSCVLRAVSSTDGMTADFSYFKREFLSETSNKIINEVKEEVDKAFDFADTQPWPQPEDALEEVYVNYPVEIKT